MEKLNLFLFYFAVVEKQWPLCCPRLNPASGKLALLIKFNILSILGILSSESLYLGYPYIYSLIASSLFYDSTVIRLEICRRESKRFPYFISESLCLSIQL